MLCRGEYLWLVEQFSVQEYGHTMAAEAFQVGNTEYSCGYIQDMQAWDVKKHI